MKGDLERQWLMLRKQWQGNPRLRILAAIVVAMLLFSVLQHLHAQQSEARDEAQRQLRRLQDVRQLSQETHWQEHARISEDAVRRQDVLLWRAASEGQAQAQLRDLLNQGLSRHGLSAMRITVTSVPNEDGRLLQVRADLNGEYVPGAWQDFIYELSTHEPRLIMESDNINRSNQRRNLYRLGLHAWFVIGEES